MCKLHMLKDSHWAPCFWINPQPLHCCTVRIVLSSLFSHRLTLWISSFQRNIGVKWSLSVIVSSSANLILIYSFLIGSSWPYLKFVSKHFSICFSFFPCWHVLHYVYSCHNMKEIRIKTGSLDQLWRDRLHPGLSKW